MIRYRVICEHAHEWDAWFASSSSFDEQVQRGLVECPLCGSTKTQRAIMAPAVTGTKKSKAKTATTQAPRAPEALSLSSAADGVVLPEPVRAFFDEMREKIAKTHDDVGDSFAREARAMHEGETDHRPIYGTATASEARELVEDGVPVVPLPKLAVPAKPEKHN